MDVTPEDALDPESLIEPAMLVFMGVVIAGIVLALYLPLFQLTSVVGHT